MGKIISFYKGHKKLCTICVIFLVLLIVIVNVRACNAKKKAKLASEDITEITESVSTSEVTVSPDTVVKEESPTFESKVGLQEDKVSVVPSSEPVSTDAIGRPKVSIYCDVIDKTAVPEKNVDNSSYLEYMSGVSLVDFPTFFGSSLTEDDIYSNSYILVGTEQIKAGDLQSLGWLANNLSKLNQNTAVYFTNLHVIGSLSDQRVVLLCSYDWYSAYGLKDTILLFEDISGSLSTEGYSAGDVISTICYVKNIRVESVNNQTVVHVEYATE